MNRLIREDNAKLNKSYTFEYDNNGNILYKGEYDFSIRDLTNGKVLEYTYVNDKLVILNDSEGPQSFEYDSLGNPTVYRGKALEWNNLRNLFKINSDITFEYDASGLRTKKIANGVETKYYYADNRLLAEKRFISTGELGVNDYLYEGEIYYTYTDKTDISYMYNANELTSFTIDRLGTQQTYYYRKNLQGDITHIYDASGALKAEYVYDAWGNHEIVVNEDNIANINPFRYRGYYYDAETGLYYLKSRYYDSETGRFINADAIEILDQSKDIINGLNLYIYCNDNPVMRIDEGGDSWWKWLIFAIGAALVVAAIVVLSVVTFGAAAAPAGMLGAILIGAAKGALIGAAIGTVAGIAGGAIYAGVTGADMGQSILSGFLIGFGGGAIIGAVIGGAVGAATYNPGIQWTSSRLHAGQRMAERGINQNMINTVLRTGKYVPQTVDKFLVSGKITAVITTAGELITVWNNTGKLQAFFETIKKIFGG